MGGEREKAAEGAGAADDDDDRRRDRNRLFSGDNRTGSIFRVRQSASKQRQSSTISDKGRYTKSLILVGEDFLVYLQMGKILIG